MFSKRGWPLALEAVYLNDLTDVVTLKINQFIFFLVKICFQYSFIESL